MTEKRKMILSQTFNLIMDAWLKGKRRIFLSGGTTSSKTFSSIQFLYLLLSTYKKPIRATVTSESMPHLKDGAIKDFKTILGEEFNDSCWDRTNFIYTFPKTKCELQFVSGDHPERFAGPRRAIWFANELNNIPRDVYREADMRTELFTIADWNPYGEFWFHEERLMDDPDNVYINELTFRSTPEIMNLPEIQSVIKTVESYKDKDPNYYRVHGLGLEGKVEGLVYPNFEQVDELPEGDCGFGLDFGFSNDPAVLTKNIIIGDKLYSKELIFETGLTNDVLARKMDLLGVRKHYDEIFADSAEPKSIEELCRAGFNVKPCEKGKGSIEYGIQKVNQYTQYWTKDSKNCIKEQRNCRYIEDKDGRLTDKITHQWTHGMDSRRYFVSSYRGVGGILLPMGVSKRVTSGRTSRLPIASSFRR